MLLRFRNIKLYLCLTVCAWGLSCAHKPAFPTPTATNNAPFIEHENWLGRNVDFSSIDSLRKQLEQHLGQSLKNRGEAHITIITPPEYDSLKKYLSIQQINALALAEKIQQTSYTPLCMGLGQKDNLKTYYVVLQSPELLNMRKKIADAFYKKSGTKKDFDPERFYPHITLGFTDRDLHESDGVIKDSHSCRYDFAPTSGK